MDKDKLLHYAKILLKKIEAVERVGNGATIHLINETEHMLSSRIKNLERAPYETWVGVPTPLGGTLYTSDSKRTVTERDAIQKLEKMVKESEELLKRFVRKEY